MGKQQCCKCGQYFKYNPHDVWFDYRGFNYDTKLVRCKNCEAINIVGYWSYEKIDKKREEWMYE